MRAIDKTFIDHMLINMMSVNMAVAVSVIVIISLAVLVITRIYRISTWDMMSKVSNWLGKVVGKRILYSENNYHRNLEIGVYTNKSKKTRNYKFLNDLIIDLGLRRRGATPYSFLFIMIVVSLVLSVLLTQVLFGNVIIGLVISPIMFAFNLCVVYTKANLEHDSRIESVIEAENIISNSISEGVIVAIRDNIDVIPEKIRGSYIDFIDNINQNNYHTVKALRELNRDLGSVSDDFIRKCIVFNEEEEHGMDGMFQDVVEINNIRMENRNEMKRQFEIVTTNFIISTSMIVLFLAGVILLYDNVAKFYFTTLIGQIILSIDMLILVLEFVYITYLRAKDV